MRKLIKTIELLFITLMVIGNVQADANIIQEAKRIIVNVSIYALDENASPNEYSKILRTTKAEQQPHLLVISGEPAVLKMDNKNNKGSLKIDFISNKQATKYKLALELQQNGKSQVTQIANKDIGGVIAFKAMVDNKSKLVKVLTRIEKTNDTDSNGVKAIAHLSINSKVKFVNPEQQYLQADKIWLSDNKLKRAARRNTHGSSMEQNFRYLYITNNDPKHIIKGVIKVKNRVNSLMSNSSGVASGSHGSLGNIPKTNRSISHKKQKNYLIEFYILPNKTAFLGQFSSSTKVTILNASFLTEKENVLIKRQKN